MTLYGKPTKYVKHVDEDTITLEPQRFYVHKFWSNWAGATARTDGQDLLDEKFYPTGSKILKHRVEMTVTPEVEDPQPFYMGLIKLSFHDIYSPALCGGVFEQASYQDTATENFAADTNAITPHLHPDKDTDGDIIVTNDEQNNQEIGGSSSGYGIKEWKLDDNIGHWIRLKKLYTLNQQPLLSERFQRIPKKVKRINEGTFYGLFLFNDSVRGATPADTQLTFNIKSEIKEMAI
jgi:hypothetical protein